MTDEKLKHKLKPDWLLTLESQSWQVELIASGLAIYGSMSLGPFLEMLTESLVPLFSDNVLDKMVFAFIYLFFVQYILVASFVGHLILRIIWAGMLGLSSVYPNGINVENESTYTISFLQKLKKEFSDLSAYSIKLDNYCSVVFSMLCTASLFLLIFVFWIFVLILISELLSYFLSPEVIDILSYIFVGTFFLYSLVLSTMSTVSYFKNTAFAEKHVYNLMQKFSKAWMSFLYEPVSYMMWIMRTNVSGKQFGVAMFFVLGPVSLFTGYMLGDKMDLFPSKVYYYMNDNPSRANHANYIDQIKSYNILRPIIQSREIETNYIKLFIPKLKREQKFKNEICGQYVKNDSLDKREQRLQRVIYEIDCANNYYKLSIDNIEFSNAEFNYSLHEHNNERGYLTYLPLDSISSGEHLLKIETGYKYEDKDGALRVIPFYKVNSNSN